MTDYVLIDFENVRVKSLTLLKAENFRVKVFLGPKNSKLPVELVLAIQELGDRAEYVTLETPGSNALDFHIAYYLGQLVASDPAGFFHVISKDTGFDPLIQHLRTREIQSARSTSIDEMPCFNQGRNNADSSKPPDPAVLDERIRIAVDDLIKRKTAKPRTTKTLRSTLHAKCGKNVPAAEIDAVYDALLERGYVKVDGTIVTYALPGA